MDPNACISPLKSQHVFACPTTRYHHCDSSLIFQALVQLVLIMDKMTFVLVGTLLLLFDSFGSSYYDLLITSRDLFALCYRPTSQYMNWMWLHWNKWLLWRRGVYWQAKVSHSIAALVGWRVRIHSSSLGFEFGIPHSHHLLPLHPWLIYFYPKKRFPSQQQYSTLFIQEAKRSWVARIKSLKYLYI